MLILNPTQGILNHFLAYAYLNNIISAPAAVTRSTSFLYRVLLMTLRSFTPKKKPKIIAGAKMLFNRKVSVSIVFQTNI